MNLRRHFSPRQFADVLLDWQWLDLPIATAMFASPFGDVFFDAADGIWVLDTLEGTCRRTFADRPEMEAVLATEEGQDRHLLAGTARGAERRGIVLGPEQIYIFRIPPVLGGGMTADDVQAIDFSVGMSINGQLHGQIKDMPPGTKISGFSVADETLKKSLFRFRRG